MPDCSTPTLRQHKEWSMRPTEAHGLLILCAFWALAACHPKSVPPDDERMAQAMRKVEADQAKSDKLVMERADADTKKQIQIQNAVRER